jgi:hypothetical protein
MVEAIGEHLYGEGRITLPEVLGRLLRERGETLALAESCTGGLSAWLITSAAGASDYFDSAVVTYSYPPRRRGWMCHISCSSAPARSASRREHGRGCGSGTAGSA